VVGDSQHRCGLGLAAQYGKDNISFVAVNPGPVRTERWAGLVDAMSRDMKIPREEADTLAPRRGSVTGRRFLAVHWDPNLPPEDSDTNTHTK